MIKKYIHPRFGEIIITKKKGQRNIRLTVSLTKGVRVSIPYLTSFSAAEKFIKAKEEWIISTIQKNRDKQLARTIPIGEGQKLQLVNGKVVYQQLSCREKSMPGKILIRYLNEVTEINLPQNCNKEAVLNATMVVIRRKAADYLPQRCKFLASENGFSYNKLFLKNNKTNWGSCSNKGNINLNIQLIRLKTELIDFVILHELCHLKYHNHGTAFHNLLDKLCQGREKELALQLKHESTCSLSVV